MTSGKVLRLSNSRLGSIGFTACRFCRLFMAWNIVAHLMIARLGLWVCCIVGIDVPFDVSRF